MPKSKSKKEKKPDEKEKEPEEKEKEPEEKEKKKGGKKKKEQWKDSDSKALLRSGIISGAITDDMKPKQVFDMHPKEHGKWKYSNWSASLTRMRNAIKRDRKRMVDDVGRYGHDIAIVQSRRTAADKVPWHRSKAAALLTADIKDRLDEEMKPCELYLSRPEYYMNFELDEFRRHIYQEVDKIPKQAIRFEKKKKAWLYPELHNGRRPQVWE